MWMMFEQERPLLLMTQLQTRRNKFGYGIVAQDPPSFGYLKRLFPSLFCSCDESSFKCETCILAKSHRVSYPISFNKNDKPFALIHSDVWGPSPSLYNLWHQMVCDFH